MLFRDPPGRPVGSTGDLPLPPDPARHAPQRPGRRRGRLAGIGVCFGGLALLAGSLASAAAQAAPSVTANWSGYAAVAPAHSSAHFRKVSGVWVEPTATCTAGRQTYSAAWVGLGGFKSGSQALEQIGTDADCERSGTPSYYAWFELVPAAPVALKLAVHAGDEISASVAVRKRVVTLRIHDLTTGQSFITKRRMSDPAPDISSADWIVEAPSLCMSSTSCTTLPLADFATVSFASASATLGSRSGAIDDSAWRLNELELQEQGAAFQRGPHFSAHYLPASDPVVATPSAIESAGGAFTVTWQELTSQSEQPSETERPSQTEQAGQSGGSSSTGTGTGTGTGAGSGTGTGAGSGTGTGAGSGTGT